MLNNHENQAYGLLKVCMWLSGINGKKLVKHDKFFEGPLGKILKGGCEVY